MATKPKSLNVTLDVLGVEALARSVGSLTKEALSTAIVDTLNVVVDDTDDKIRNRMNAGINLSDEYLRRKVRITKATRGTPEAEIAVSDEPVPLGRYDARTQVVDAKSPTSKLKGNPALGIPVGKKQKGVVVQVLRGSVNTSFMERGYLMPLRKGNLPGGNGIGVFARRRSGNAKHRYGPSVYQLFSYQADQATEEIADDLEEALIDKVNEVIEKGIE